MSDAQWRKWAIEMVVELLKLEPLPPDDTLYTMADRLLRYVATGEQPPEPK